MEHSYFGCTPNGDVVYRPGRDFKTARKVVCRTESSLCSFCQGKRGIDHAQMSEGLGKISQRVAGLGIDFLAK